MPALIIFGSVFFIILVEEILRRKPKTKGISGGLDWRIQKGVLMVSGKGPMENYTDGNKAPWGVKIKDIVLDKGVTTIGESAFANCRNLKTVTVPAHIQSIGSHAFAYCVNLETVVVEAAKGSVKLGSGVFPEGVSVVYKD